MPNHAAEQITIVTSGRQIRLDQTMAVAVTSGALKPPVASPSR
jgi:hypothetical protein